MPISLETLRSRFVVRLGVLDSAFDRHLIGAKAMRSVDRFSLQEGMVSALWQAWAAFCRSTLIGSAGGISDAAGNQVTSPYSGRTEMEIAFIARQLANQQSTSSIKVLAGNHLEPTWGDLNKLNLIASGLQTSNKQTLLSAFGVAVAIGDLQLCRNASAHMSRDRMNDVKSARVRYSQTAFRHPSDMIFWSDPSTGGYVWKTWSHEMRAVAQLAVR